MTIGCWSDMPSLIRMAFERLRPGGWMESQEPSPMPETEEGQPEIPETNPFLRLGNELQQASDAARRPLAIAHHLRQWYAEAGFVDIHEKVYKIPLNGWPRNQKLKRIGELWHANLANGLSAFAYGLLHRVKGMSQEEIEVSLVDVRKALGDQRLQAYHKFYVVWGRKPEDCQGAGRRRG